MWFDFFGGLLYVKHLCYTRGKCDDKERHSNREHLFPRVSGYKRRSDIKEECIMEVPVSLIDSLLDLQFVS